MMTEDKIKERLIEIEGKLEALKRQYYDLDTKGRESAAIEIKDIERTIRLIKQILSWQ